MAGRGCGGGGGGGGGGGVGGVTFTVLLGGLLAWNHLKVDLDALKKTRLHCFGHLILGGGGGGEGEELEGLGGEKIM